MKYALRITLAVLLVLALVAPGVAAGITPGYYSPYTIDRMVVHNVGSDETTRGYVWGGLSDNYLAYQMMSETTSQVLLCDLRTETTSTIDDGLQSQWLPAISGENVMYCGFDGSDWGIYRYWLADGTSELVTRTPEVTPVDIDDHTGMFCFSQYSGLKSAAKQPEHPDSGKHVGVADVPYSGRIYVGDLGDPTDLEPLNDGEAFQYAPSISGDYVAYFEFVEEVDDHSYYDIKVQNIFDETDVTTVAEDVIPGYLDFSGDLVTWGDYTSPSSNVWHLYGYNLSAEERFTVYDGDAFCAHDGMVSGSKIYFNLVDHVGDEDTRLMVYDTVLDSYAELPSAPQQSAIAVQGNRLVWAGDDYSPRSYITVSTLGQPNVFIDTDEFVDYDAMPFIAGFVADDGIGIGDANLSLQISPDGQLWETVDTATSDGDGDFFLNAPKLKTWAYYRVVYMGKVSPFWGVDALRLSGDVMHFSAYSHPENVVARASVGIASGPSILKKNQYYTARGLIAPTQNKNVQAAGRIECYRKVNGVWKYQKSYSTAFTNGGYWAQMKFTTKGAWRYRMHFLGSNTNAPDYGPWRGVTVR